ncbi:MAG: MOSC domain-containing protein [Acidimicrobiia bacterium]|nr:MOSC domain-containing protein [Acidimicrobiia bacterium]
MGSIHSLNVGRPMPSKAGEGHFTGIGKVSVAEAVFRAPGPKLGGLGSGVEGDFIGSQRHHGGDYQAVYAYSREELDRWEERLGRELPSGMFGENLTTLGIDVDGARIGERWSVGDEVVLEVCGPRIPCATFQARMGERGWVKRFTQVGNSGAYMAVVAPGIVRHGDTIEVVSQPDHEIDIRVAFRAFSGDLEAAERVVAEACLREPDHNFLAARLSRQRS